MNILRLIASDSFITVNKELIKHFGLEGAVLIGELASEYDYWTKNNGITPDGYFFSTIENIDEKTGLSEHRQRQAIKKLEEQNIVSVKVKGLPAKRYIKLDEQNLVKLFEASSEKLQAQVSENSETCSVKIQKQEPEKFKRNNNINNNNIINNNISKINDNIYSSQITEIIEYLNQKANTSYRTSTERTQKLIIAKLKQEFTVDDFKHVIDVKCADWLNNPEFAQYLRPETLFGNKFESYLNSKVSKPTPVYKTPATPEKSSSTPIQLQPSRLTKEELDKYFGTI